MKIGITGASGHIGASLTRELLKRNYDLRVLEHNDSKGFENLNVEIIKGDINDISSLSKFCNGLDIVFHLAAKISIGLNSYDYIKLINFVGTQNIVNECKKANVRRLIYFSSIHALQHYPLDKPLDETRPLVINSHIAYEQTKAMAEQWVLQQISDNFDIIVLNPTSIIGPYDFKPSLMGQMMIKFYKGKLPLLVPGGYDWVDVRDVAMAAANAIKQGRSGERYIVSGQWETIEELSRLINKVCEKNNFLLVIPLALAKLALPFISAWSKLTKSTPLYTKQSLTIINNVNKNIRNDKAKKELNFNPRPLSDTIKDTMQWFKENNYI